MKVKKIDYQREIDNLDVNPQFILTETELLLKFIKTLDFVKENLQLETDIEPLKLELRTWKKELDKWREGLDKWREGLDKWREVNVK